MKAIKIASAITLSLVAVIGALMYIFFIPMYDFDDLKDGVENYLREPHY